MTDVEQQKTAAVVDTKDEAPALPTTEPPKDEDKKADAPAAEEPKKEETPVVPIDIREDPIGWIGQQIPQAVHIVNYHVLDWLQKFAIEDETKRAPLPGKNEAVTRKQFLGFLRDGRLLAALANRLSPGTVETIHEGDALKEKANQTANIESFANWAKTNLGIAEDKVLSAADLLEKGKEAYPVVFENLWQAAIQAKDKFGAASGIDVDAVIAAASQAVPRSLIQTILNFFKRATPTHRQEKQAVLDAEEKEKAEKKETAEEANEEKAEKVEATPAPPVASN